MVIPGAMIVLAALVTVTTATNNSISDTPSGCRADDDCESSSPFCAEGMCLKECVKKYECIGVNYTCFELYSGEIFNCTCPESENGYSECYRKYDCDRGWTCPPHWPCRNGYCSDPCRGFDLSDCGEYTTCAARNKRGVCKCLPGYHGYPPDGCRPGHKKYTFPDKQLPWADATEYCKSRGLELATIESEDELRYFNDEKLLRVANGTSVNEKLWIAAYCESSVRCYWVQSGGPSRLRYANWGVKEPKEQCCVLLHALDGLNFHNTMDASTWITGNCSDTHDFLCQHYDYSGVEPVVLPGATCRIDEDCGSNILRCVEGQCWRDCYPKHKCVGANFTCGTKFGVIWNCTCPELRKGLPECNEKYDCDKGWTCPPHWACMNSRCEDPCNVFHMTACGEYTTCEAHNGTAVCSCLPGYHGYPPDGCHPGHKKYTVVEKELNWTDAAQYCRYHGWELATIESAEEYRAFHREQLMRLDGNLLMIAGLWTAGFCDSSFTCHWVQSGGRKRYRYARLKGRNSGNQCVFVHINGLGYPNEPLDTAITANEYVNDFTDRWYTENCSDSMFFMCHHYEYSGAEAVSDKRLAPPNNFDQCGKSNRDIQAVDIALIRNGKEGQRQDFPWAAGLYYKDDRSGLWEQRCGGTLISPLVVLTAAHCVVLPNARNITPSDVTVKLGQLSRSYYSTEPTAVLATVREFVVPDRYLGLIYKYAEDIALLVLNEPVLFSEAVRPACVDWSGVTLPQHGSSLYINGWGSTDEGNASTTLLWARQTYIDFKTCKNLTAASEVSFITPDKFCVESVGDAGPAKGDSGGGITLIQGKIHFVVGIISTRLSFERRVFGATSLSSTSHWSWLLRHWPRLHKDGFCKEAGECAVNMTCVSGVCVDPCRSYLAVQCSDNMVCKGENHRAVCRNKEDSTSKTFFLVKQKLSWAMAAQHCANISSGGQLASIMSEIEQRDFEIEARKTELTVWTAGVCMTGSKESCKWLDANATTPLTVAGFTHFMEGQVSTWNSHHGRQRCVAANSWSSWRWFALDCARTRAFVCELNSLSTNSTFALWKGTAQILDGPQRTSRAPGSDLVPLAPVQAT